jgi:hypothetical protein
MDLDFVFLTNVKGTKMYKSTGVLAAERSFGTRVDDPISSYLLG